MPLLTDSKPLENSNSNDVSIPGNGLQQRKYCLAVTGDVFRWMIDYGNEDTLRRVSLDSRALQYYLLIVKFVFRSWSAGRFSLECRPTRSMNLLKNFSQLTTAVVSVEMVPTTVVL